MHDNNPDQNSSSNGATDSNTPPQACVNPKFPLNIGKSNARLRLFSDFCAEDKFAEARLLEAQTRIIEAELKSADLKSADRKSAKIEDSLPNTMKRLEKGKMEDALDNTLKRLEMCRNTQNEGMKKFWEKRIEQLHNKLLGANLKSEEIRLFFPDW